MSEDIAFPDLGSCDLTSDTMWETVYKFLTRRVRYWVQSSQVAFWWGQEEDIVEDIVQETVKRTFTFSVEYFPQSKEGGFFSCNLLKRISMFIASNHYREREQQDSRFVYTGQHMFSPQGYAIIYERVDPFEIVADNVIQEWYCRLLVEEIIHIPVRPRIALLTDLANHTCFSSRPTKLQDALQKVGIQLQDYQQSLPNNCVVRRAYNFLLSFACRQIMAKGQERLRELENAETIYDSQEPVVNASKLESGATELDAELEALVARLEATAPCAPIDPAFKKALRDKLLDIQAEYSVAVPMTTEEEAENALTSLHAQGDTGERDDDQQSLDADFNATELDAELEALVAHLEATAPSATSDPAFKKALRDKLLDLQSEHHVTASVPLEEIPAETEKVINSLSEELRHSNSGQHRRQRQ